MDKSSDTSGSAPSHDARRLIRQAVHEATDALDHAPPIPKEIAGYRILELLGRGGMGLVYRAQQQSPKRIVALKVLASESLTKKKIRRFIHEAEFLGRLQHPGIARIYEAGVAETAEGRCPFLAMELIEGARSITHYARAKELRTRLRLELIAEVCDAVEHAHRKGLIHRDLKPANILVDMDGRPKIVDFGVARATDSDVEATTVGTDIGRLIGTIPYMSPEQASGNTRDVDTRSDVYALGVVAYQLLTDRMPYPLAEMSHAQMLQTICEADPSRLSSIDRSLRGDVETIVLKALAKDPDRRYQSAAAFGDDIRRHLNDQTVLARPPSTMYQFRKFARRNKALVSGILGVVLALVLGIVGVSWQAAKTRREADTSLQLLRMFLDSGSQFPEKWLGEPANVVLLHGLSDNAGTLFREEPEYEARLGDRFGNAYLQLGEADRAEIEFRRHLELARKIHGPAHQMTLRAYDMVVDALLSGDRIEEAEELINEVLDLAGYGEGHVPDSTKDDSSYHLALRILRLRFKLAATGHHLGRLEASERLCRHILEELQRILPPESVSFDDHESVVGSRWRLALLILDRKGDPQTAVELLTAVCGAHLRRGAGQPVHALARVSLAEALHANGETVPALEELDVADNIPLNLTLPLGRAAAMQILLVRGEIIMDTNPKGAESLMGQALAMQEKEKAKHWRTALVRARYAECLARLGNLEEAVSQLETAQAVLRRRFGEEDYRVKRVEDRLEELQ